MSTVSTVEDIAAAAAAAVFYSWHMIVSLLVFCHISAVSCSICLFGVL